MSEDTDDSRINAERKAEFEGRAQEIKVPLDINMFWARGPLGPMRLADLVTPHTAAVHLWNMKLGSKETHADSPIAEILTA